MIIDSNHHIYVDSKNNSICIEKLSSYECEHFEREYQKTYSPNTGEFFYKKDIVKDYYIFYKTQNTKENIEALLHVKNVIVQEIETQIQSVNLLYDYYNIYTKDESMFFKIKSKIRKNKIKSILKNIN